MAPPPDLGGETSEDESNDESADCETQTACLDDQTEVRFCADPEGVVEETACSSMADTLFEEWTCIDGACTCDYEVCHGGNVVDACDFENIEDECEYGCEDGKCVPCCIPQTADDICVGNAVVTDDGCDLTLKDDCSLDGETCVNGECVACAWSLECDPDEDELIVRNDCTDEVISTYPCAGGCTEDPLSCL